jgi:hypothetical protein
LAKGAARGAEAPDGAVALGGGYSLPTSSIQVLMDAPLGNGWLVEFSNLGSPTFAYAYARCAQV